MDASFGESAVTGRALGYRLGWTAYVGPSVGLLLTLGIAYCLSFLSWVAAVCLCWGGLIFFTLRVLHTLSVELYTDVAGVWVFRGVFPWNKGTYGVRWRDVEDATMFTGLVPWLTKSYRIRVGHRFTRGSEIQLAHVRRGDDAVRHINQRHAAEIQADMAMTLHDGLMRGRNG